jgi:D-3-phosphoglycerate dehydrogenase
VARASLDVFGKEPCAGNPLLEFDNVVVTPHIGATTHEAQYRVGTDVATYVLTALRGEIVSNTVNLPSLLGEEIAALRPYSALAEYLGKLYYQLEKAPTERVELNYYGEIARKETGLITLFFLKGLLTPALGSSVNLVNAAWLAENRGIKVYERRDEASSAGFTSMISVCITRNGNKAEYAGTIAWDNGPRFVRINNYRMDIIPTPHMLFVDHIDRPGVIGPFASTLGRANINIAMMQVGRCNRGEEALMTMSVDSPVDEATLEQLRKIDGILSVRVVSL